MIGHWLGCIAVCGAAALEIAAAQAAEPAAPRYDHIFVIIEENHTAGEIIGNPATPILNRLAQTYGYASKFYAERHPSEPNYVAILGGNTFGIRDDDAFYCKPAMSDWACPKSGQEGYVGHTVAAPNLAAALEARGLSWKGYFESISEPGSLAWHWPSPQSPVAGQPEALYASKHNGFISFKSVQDDPRRAQKLVGFDQLERDIASGALPNYAQIVPNQCNDMHGLHGANVPDDCAKGDGLVARADRLVGMLTDRIMATPAWKGAGNFAIVITFDENDDHNGDGGPDGCCGSVPGDPNNPGGGHIPTIVITNHGPRHLVDPTAYNHYSLLRTTETAFGIADYLGHAADVSKGVRDMTPLFAVTRP
jgi:hypothetical protein